jgi:hypothetical protein
LIENGNLEEYAEQRDRDMLEPWTSFGMFFGPASTYPPSLPIWSWAGHFLDHTNRSSTLHHQKNRVLLRRFTELIQNDAQYLSHRHSPRESLSSIKGWTVSTHRSIATSRSQPTQR